MADTEFAPASECATKLSIHVQEFIIAHQHELNPTEVIAILANVIGQTIAQCNGVPFDDLLDLAFDNVIGGVQSSMIEQINEVSHGKPN